MQKLGKPLEPSLVKQIAGRAGRFGKKYADAGGLVTTVDQEDVNYLKQCMALKIPDIQVPFYTLDH